MLERTINLIPSNFEICGRDPEVLPFKWDLWIIFLVKFFFLRVKGLNSKNICTSAGNENGADCWKGQDPELRTWIEKSTKTKHKSKKLKSSSSSNDNKRK